MIAISGASGHIGGSVARILSARGLATRLLGRNPSRLPNLTRASVARIDFGDPESVAEALEGIDTFFMVSAHESRNRAAEQVATVQAAATTGISRIVYLSFVAAAPDCTFTFGRDHWATEQAIIETGLPHTILRDNMYADFLPHFAGADGTIRGPAGDGRLAPVAQRDVVACAARALTDPPPNTRYDLTGPSSISMTEVAHLLTELRGTAFRFVDETVEQAHASRAGMGADWEIDGWISSYLAIAAGDLAEVTTGVSDLLDRPAIPVRETLSGRAA